MYMVEKSLTSLLDVDSQEGKDLGALLKKWEESYIYKAIDWIDQSLRFAKYRPDSKIAKSLDTVKDFMFYATILGILPGEKQEKYAKHLGYDKLKFTKYSLMYGFCVDAVRFATVAITSPPVALSLYIWGFAVFAEDCARLTYALLKKKPIGSFIYVEIPYRILKPAFNYINNLFKKRAEKKADAQIPEILKEYINTSLA